MLAAFLAAALWPAAAAHADGKVFAVEIADVSGAQIPDQAALICWDPATRTQTLAIETRFVGRGTEFGWVVPLPSRPEVKPGTAGMFPSLPGMFAPVVKTRGMGGAPFLVVMIVIVLLMLYAKRWMAIVIGLVLGVFLVALLLPSLGTARGGAGGDPAAPDFVDRRIVGDFEVTTLESPQGQVVVDWLRSHGFHVPAAAETVIGQYAREKWSFVATRLVREADSGEPSTAHPLVFTFTTDDPVYPMRLTGADATRDLIVELFVFGPSRAAASGFRVAAAGPVWTPEDRAHRSYVRPSDRMITVSHSAVTPLVEGAKFATRLTGTLEPRQMGQDVGIAWNEGGAAGRSAQNWRTAGGIGLDVGLGVMFIVLCIVGHFEQTRKLARGFAVKRAMLAGLSIGLVTFVALPKVTSHSMRDEWRSNRELLRELDARFRPDLKSTEPVALASASAWLDELIARRSIAGNTRLSRGDAPGQVDLRILDGMICLVEVSAAGAEEWQPLWHADEPDTE